MTELLALLLLPKEISAFEDGYLRRVNRVALLFLAAHVPVFTLIAWLNHTGPVLTAGLTLAVLSGPVLAYKTVRNPRSLSLILGVTAMFMGALLVHIGQGPAQIEMHFYFFAVLAMCSVFANPLVIVAATVTVALHHVIVWLLLPQSVFNYDADWWVVAVHALFVVLEAVAACFIARSFFDNVIGLERIVQTRTAALDAMNRDMRLLLDNVDQGFLTIDREGRLAQERSAAVDRWCGTPADDASWFDYLGTLDRAFAGSSRVAWTEVVADVMPIELTLAQMPGRLAVRDRTFSVGYRSVGATEPHERFLVVMSDITEQIAREFVEAEHRDVIALFERVLADRSGFEAFFADTSATVAALSNGRVVDREEAQRLVHTLKGNASLFGVLSIVRKCHLLEDWMLEHEGPLASSPVTRALATRWSKLAADVEQIVGARIGSIEIERSQYEALLGAVDAGESGPALTSRIRAFRLEPTAIRLRHFAQQAQRIAGRLEKHVDVRVEDNGIQLDASRWSALWRNFTHALRNAVAHGIESEDVRRSAGKASQASIVLRTRTEGGRLFVEIEDDGQGIDWSAVRERAVSFGLEVSSDEALCEALFVDGLSTAAQITDLSGRGVGMGALRRATRALGGELVVVSRRGNGTLVQMSFANELSKSEDGRSDARGGRQMPNEERESP